MGWYSIPEKVYPFLFLPTSYVMNLSEEAF